MRFKIIELSTLYFVFPFLFIIDVFHFETRGYYFLGLLLYIFIQSIRYRKDIRFKFKENITIALNHGIKLSLFAALLIIPFNFILDVKPLSNTEPRFLRFVFIMYPMISAPAQEYFFRTYFYARYGEFDKTLLLLLNVFAFAIIHLMYGGWLSVYFSAISAFVINLNYRRYRNDLSIAVIHAIHGMAIFLLGYQDYFTDWFR